MNKCSNIIAASAVFICILAVQSCTKTTEQPKVLTHTITVNWFRGSSTPQATAFLDLYNGKAYTPAEAASHETSIDAFCFDNRSLPQVNLVSMNSFGAANYSAHDSFSRVVGPIPFKLFTESSFAEAKGLLPVEFANIRNNNDIKTIYNQNAYKDGTYNMPIDFNNRDTNMFYMFRCSANNKRGFFRIKNAEYLPAGTMTIEVKVEQ